jgi:hypothetical protein
MWGGWGSNPRPADYENYGPALPTLYLHEYHGAVPPDGPHCTVCTDGSIHEPVHDHHSERLTSTTERHHSLDRRSWVHPVLVVQVDAVL